MYFFEFPLQQSSGSVGLTLMIFHCSSFNFTLELRATPQLLPSSAPENPPQPPGAKVGSRRGEAGAEFGKLKPIYLALSTAV